MKFTNIDPVTLSEAVLNAGWEKNFGINDDGTLNWWNETDHPSETQICAEIDKLVPAWTYTQAAARLSQYVLSEGRPEVKEMVPTGETKVNPITGEKEDVLVEAVTQAAIEPLPETVEIWEHVDGSTELVKKSVRNPAIVQDEAERAAAQAIVDATPEEVKAAA